MKRRYLFAGAALALTSSLALASPESLLPPIFDQPAPAPAPAPRPTAAPAPAPGPAQTSSPVIQPLPRSTANQGDFPVTIPSRLPSLKELEEMDPDELDELFGLKPKFDIPPGARRALRQVGVLGAEEGGFAAGSLAGQPASLVRAALKGTRGPLVSRWGHILLRRALASRLDAPAEMDPVEFAALRAALLNRMGEAAVSRSLVQDVDSANYDQALTAAAFDAYVASSDIVGICPVARLKGDILETPDWTLARGICAAFDGEARTAERDLERARYYGVAPQIDALLAQRFAGAAGDGRRAVNIEWTNVDELTAWRHSLARALSVEIPANLLSDLEPRLRRNEALMPAVPLGDRAVAADLAARDGILSARAMVDLYGQIWADGEAEDGARERAATLRIAYVAADPAERVEAIRALWASADAGYGRQVLTAYAAARLPVDTDLVEEPAPFIASMLSAGLDRNAAAWARAVPAGSEAWALLAVGAPGVTGAVSSGAVDQFIDDDSSADKRKSRFLVAALAGLGRLNSGDAQSAARQLGVSLTHDSKWARAIDRAGEYRNPALVALLAGLGMQGSGWDKMTARHLFHIVRALDRAGLNAEARMIASEAVARG